MASGGSKGGDAKIDKIIARLQQRIAEGQFYEAQQQTRVVVARYTKAHTWQPAIDILFGVAQSLLRAGQGGSGGDLCVLLVDVYGQAELAPDAVSRGRLLTCLRLFDAAEPTRKKFIGEMISWSSKFGEYPAGDPELHHVAGSLYAAEHEPYDAERHLLLGTRDSAETLTRMEYTWYRQQAADGEAHTAPLYAARAVLPYLLVANMRAANACYRGFCAALLADSPGLGAQEVSSAAGGEELKVLPSLPLLNFLGLLLLAVQKGSPELYRDLRRKYAGHIGELGGAWDESLEMIAEMYFGIQRPRQSNPLMDMMGSLFGGGLGGAGAGNSGAGASRRAGPAGRRVQAPVAEGLD